MGVHCIANYFLTSNGGWFVLEMLCECGCYWNVHLQPNIVLLLPLVLVCAFCFEKTFQSTNSS